MTTHVQHVRSLYKVILRLHRGLPLEMQVLGDNYVKSEFKLHKKCTNEEAMVFMHQWTVTIYKFRVINKNLIEHSSFSGLCSDHS